MPQPLAGPGLGLPIPTYLYPSQLNNAPVDVSNNTITLAAGQALPIPAGDWYVSGSVLVQYLDPITGIWRIWSTSSDQPRFIKSDGFTMRLANLSGCPVAAVVTAGGSGYASGTTTVTASTGGSTWQAIVGGQVSVVSITNAGANYSVAPLVLIPSPAPGTGVPATAYTTISAGTVSGVTLSNVGAGYTTAPTAIIVPNPTDPNIGVLAITQATVTLGLTNAGKLTAVLCTNSGTPQASATAPTLSVGGAGTGATVSAVMMQSVVSASITGAGIGYGTAAAVSTINGVTGASPTYTNPNIELINLAPRPAQIGVTLTAGSLTAIGGTYDAGLFTGTPNAVVTGNGLVTAAATVALVMGGVPQTVLMQPAP